jgi:hypothetical protein
MDKIEFPESYDDITTEDLTALREQAHAAALALVEPDAPSNDDVAEALRLDAGIDAIDEVLTTRAAAEAEKTEQVTSLRTKFTTAPEEDESEAEGEEDAEAEAEGDEDEETADQPEAEKDEAEKVAAAAKPKARATLAKRTIRPAPPARQVSPVTITAAADVPDFSTGQALEDMSQVGQALVARMRGFGVPSGDGETENLQHYGVAKFRMDFDEELTTKPFDDDTAVLTHAANEARLPDKSLTASGGWCAPSETLYDLCVLESMDGLLSLPEVNVTRGGIRFTKGPQWGDFYSSIGFQQTEAQAIAGTTKACYEVTCPTFTDVRLDAIGVCIKAPILTNAAYPEVVNRILSGAMVVHAHKVNASAIAKMVALSGAAQAAIDYGASTQSTMATLSLVAGIQRQKYKMAIDSPMEAVLPYWVKDVIREDMAERGGRPIDAITDAYIMNEFSVRHIVPQFVYDWQEQALDNVGWPATFQVLLYPAGTFVKGTSDVITLNAVYDAASLATNIYTALFFEQGLLIANLCNEARLITVPTCASGKTGLQTAAVCGIDT